MQGKALVNLDQFNEFMTKITRTNKLNRQTANSKQANKFKICASCEGVNKEIELVSQLRSKPPLQDNKNKYKQQNM